ncbi:Ferric reductase-like transmembrane domain-containing protein [Sulfidibacter corallicola]|uniref:Ferric reductase-like transmembrane domain-containing protein n=1 Tax=Sulfidibacter corallicola TaxID=2818388 RepID=A0A8A4TVI6_SULCO|nr:Rieske 2Fe-2S domain-containing protein [Sulfidibacter corallicola]QTD50545.1 ferric reductase-like transmembrane domain-containing protein [Sulfidibacter corallicola]
MSLNYQAVGWNRQKKIYDRTMVLGVLLYLGLFIGITATTNPTATAETLMIRGFGTAALLLLHIILAIGPLARLNPMFLPLLYNRRHMGVTMFVLALAHAVLAMIQFHAGGDQFPLISLFTSNGDYSSVSQFPFQPLGFFALAILFFMAATSHDFWLANLTAPTWKRLHMMVYVAYFLLIGHVVLGVLQAESSPFLAGVLGLGAAVVWGLHLTSAWLEKADDEEGNGEGFVDVCAVEDIPEKRARIVCLSGERVAVFKYDGKVSAISNVCRHQNGPLGEGKVVDGCVTCPWHGYQYRPHDGASPPPFTEKVPTFRVKVSEGRVLVDPRPLAPGTAVEPAVIAENAAEELSS